MELNIRSTAVIAVHFQNDIVTAEGAFGGFFAAQVAERDVFAHANTVLHATREAGVPVIYTRVGFEAGHKELVANNPLLGIVAQQGCLVLGTHQTEIVAEVEPHDGDLVITNGRVSNFANSPLDTILRGRGVDTIVIFGVATNLSVEDTARHASNLGYRVILVEDACSAADDAAHRATVATLSLLAEVSNSEEVAAALAG
jgi:nicotinamidase-related amidase